MDEEHAKLGFAAQMPQDGENVPAEFQVFPAGTIQIEGAEPFTVDDSAMNSVIEQFRARGLDMVVDYEHQTEGDAQAPAAGWIKQLENRDKEGLWAKVEWTQKAREYLANREYRYYSPVFLVSKGSRRLIELLRVALTNAPRLNWIKPIVAKAPYPLEGPAPAERLGRGEGGGEGEKNHISNFMQMEGPEMEFLKLIAKQLGLGESSTQDAVLAEVKKLQQPPELIACKEVLEALELKHDTSRSEVIASIHALRQRPDGTVIKEVAALKARLAERDRDDLVAAAIKDCKITPAQREWAEKYALNDPEGFRLFIAKAPIVVPVDKVNVAREPGSQVVTDDTQLHINKLLGVTDETWKKYNPAQA